jgi:hypothetical protein
MYKIVNSGLEEKIFYNKSFKILSDPNLNGGYFRSF